MLENLKFEYSPKVIINYHIYSDNNIDSSKSTIICLHGFASSLYTWDSLKPLMKGHKLILIDLKGFGESSKPVDNFYSAKDQAEIIKSMIEKLNLKDYILMGHSLGGAIAVYLYFLLDSKRPKALILISPLILMSKLKLSAKLLKNPFLKYLMLYCIPHSIKAKIVLKFIFKREKEVIKEKSDQFADYMRQPGAYNALLRTADSLVPNIYNELNPILERIEQPVLIIWGDKDKVINSNLANLLNKKIKNSKLYIIDNCGHLPHVETPEMTAKLIDDFLERS